MTDRLNPNGRNNPQQMYVVPDPVSDNEKIKFLLEGFAKQELIVKAAQEVLEEKRAEIIALFGERRDNVSSENAVVAFEHGGKVNDWQNAAMQAGVSPDKYKLYAKPPKIDWRKMCKNEGVADENVPFTRRPSKVTVKTWPRGEG